MKIKNAIIHPYRTIERIRWKITKKKLHFCGKRVTVKWCFIISHPENIRIGNDVHIGHHCEIHSFPEYNGKKTGFTPELSIEDNVVMADYSYISCLNKVVIGCGTLLGANTFITDNYHGDNTNLNIPPDQRELYSKGPVIIGENVWIGRNVCVMPNVVIGNNVIIGANAVVTHSISDNCIVAGVPAKIIKRIE